MRWEAGNWKLEIGNLGDNERLEIGNWKLGERDWKLEIGN